MLSIDNENPASEIPQLNNSSCIDDDDGDKLLLVDLFSSERFSIRDYAFSSRSKGIENSWPFSGENLQFCLKNGLKNVLPPFESSEAVKKTALGDFGSEKGFKLAEAVEKPTLGTVVSEKGEEDPAARNQEDHGMFVDSDGVKCNSDPPIVVEGGKESTCSEIDSFPTKKSPEFEADILPERSVAKPKPTANRTTQGPVKKHRLVVKVGSSANLSSKEDNPVNSFMVSEAMASKVCPVCKTFSSSSNTTLNAHIDQCLSGESTTKWSSPSSSKVMVKNKIKPRKIKSMVEIYETALHCTLEELDRRNGSNWAGNSNLPAQGTERAVAAEQKKLGSCSSPHANLEDIPDEGDVYIDATGTKVRILSKSRDHSSPSPKKFVSCEKVSKFLVSKKKKLIQLQKRHDKLMKHGRKNFSPRPHRTFSETDDDQDKNFSGGESSEKEPRVTRHIRPQDEPKFSRQDMIRGWGGSKRTEIKRKSSGREDVQLSGVENNRLSRGRRPTLTNETSLSSPGISKRTDKPSSYEIRERMELPVRKRLRHASVDGEKSSRVVLEVPSSNVKELRKEKRPNQEDRVSQMSKRKVQMYGGQVKKVDHPVGYPKASSGRNLHTTKDRMSSGPGSQSNFKRKLSAFKKSGVEFLSESNESGYNHERMARTFDKVSFAKTRALKTRSGGESMISRKEGSRELKSMSYLHDSEDQGGSFMLDSSVSGGRSDDDDEDDDESAQKNISTSEEEDLHAERMQFQQPDSSSDGHSDMERFSEVLKETLHIEDQDPILNNGQPQEMFSGTEVVPENLNVTVTELGSDGMDGNYFEQVDPIPIPGPPGSFLPSPGHMISEDLAGHSSLTSSRIQSSDDRHELVDHSSDSPVSALSTISNPTLARSDSKLPAANCNSLQALDGAERTVLDKLTINVAIDEKVPFRFNDQPCCCSRKEGSTSLNYQESQLLRRRSVPSEVMLPSRLDSFKSEMSSVTSARSSGDDMGTKSPAGHVPNSPSTPNPVLRLMGKDLIVNNEETVVSSQIRNPLSLANYHMFSQAPQWPSPSDVYPGQGYTRVSPTPTLASPGIIPSRVLGGSVPVAGSLMHQMGASSANPNPGWRKAVNPRDIIVIDDAPENEPHGVMQPVVPMAPASVSGSRRGSNIYGYHPYRGLPVDGPSFWMPSGNAGNGANGNPPPGKWNWPPEGSTMNPNPNPGLRPKFYSYPNFK